MALSGGPPGNSSHSPPPPRINRVIISVVSWFRGAQIPISSPDSEAARTMAQNGSAEGSGKPDLTD
eukprot:2693349-Alexandrium_andersonii.AAC.1